MTKDQIIEKWEGLESRERIMVSVGGVLLTLMLAYSLVWVPLKESIATLSENVAMQQGQVAEMQSMAKDLAEWEAASTPAAANNAGGTALVTLVDQTARKLDINVNQWQPDGTHRVKVKLDSVPFDDLMKWLATLHQKHAVNASIAVINKSKDEGKVDARITLEESAS